LHIGACDGDGAGIIDHFQGEWFCCVHFEGLAFLQYGGNIPPIEGVVGGEAAIGCEEYHCANTQADQSERCSQKDYYKRSFHFHSPCLRNTAELGKLKIWILAYEANERAYLRMFNMRETSGKMFSLRLTGESQKSFKPIHHEGHEGTPRKNQGKTKFSFFFRRF